MSQILHEVPQAVQAVPWSNKPGLHSVQLVVEELHCLQLLVHAVQLPVIMT
jgi:hypothetical protein